jgi:CRISPR-associated protein Cas1
MKRLLNTIYITTDGAYLHKDGETITISVEGELKTRIPIHGVESIVCMGRAVFSTPFVGFCAEHGVSIAFIDEKGRFLSRMCGPVSGNVLLRRKQYKLADDTNFCTEISKTIISAKIANQRAVLLRAIRDHPEKINLVEMERVTERLKTNLSLLAGERSLDRIRGIEGDSASLYFSVFDSLITAQKESFFMRERNRRPPTDNMNALLSFIYTLLTCDIVSALESVGLDPQVGFLHRDRPGRPSLALDILEEFRPFFADRLALSLVNLHQVQPKGFRTTESGAVIMDDETRRIVLIAYQKRKQETLMHPYINEQIEVGLLPYVQALLLARFLRGDVDGYPAYFWR